MWGGGGRPESDVIVKTLWLILEYCGSSLQLSLAWLHHVLVTALRGSWVGFGWFLWALGEILGAQVGGQDGQVGRQAVIPDVIINQLRFMMTSGARI